MHILLSLTASLCCMLIGCFKAQQLKNRHSQLRAWRTAFHSLEQAVSHMSFPLPELLHYAGRDAALPLALWARQLQSAPATALSELIPAAWGELTQTEWQCITQGLCSLQQEHVDAQQAALAKAQEDLRLYLDDAALAYRQKYRLYLYLGALSGVALFILLY